MKRAIVSVINDLSTDQRVHKHCMLLRSKGYDVLLIGREKSDSSVLDQRDYNMHRMRLPFEKGPFFYVSFNFALFVQLLFRRSTLLFSNDLDTLLPNFLVSKLKRKSLVYDSHEFFTEVPELVNRPSVQNIWRSLESFILPKLKFSFTVNQSIADLYAQRYGIKMKVIRNLPTKGETAPISERSELGLPEDKKIIILQGAGINIHRGVEEAVEAMVHLEEATLLILGSGDVVAQLKERVNELGISEKVIFKNRMPYSEMMAHTRLANLGLSLDKDTNINYRFSLPNKLFDYIHAGIPVLASDLIEVRRIVEEYQVGEIVRSYEPRQLAAQIEGMLSSSEGEVWKGNALQAAQKLHWEVESEVLTKLIDELNG